MMLSQDETYQLSQRFPQIELSYETIPHRKVSPAYNICLAIPQGKKGYLWFTYNDEEDVCFFMELNRDKKVGRMRIIDFPFDKNLCLGTILYGSLVEVVSYIPIFVIEDIYFHKGVTMKSLLFGERLSFIERIFESTNIIPQQQKNLILSLPPIWSIDKKEEYDCVYEIPSIWKSNISAFQIHHIQYRSLYDKGPYMNVFNNNSILHKKPATYIPVQIPIYSNYRMDITKPQYKSPTVFLVSADIQYDVYHLFAYGKRSQHIYYNVAYIPNYQTSVMMNSIFRKVKENENLDAIEESDDEEEFEDTREDKYVDLQKSVAIECIYSSKFRKWVPKQLVQGKKIIHISLL
jgi:hypothetical protein